MSVIMPGITPRLSCPQTGREIFSPVPAEWNTLRRKRRPFIKTQQKRLAVPGLTSRKKYGRCFFTPAGDRKGKIARTDTLYPPCPVPVPIKIKKSCLVPYCQAAGLPYCSPPAREYPSRLRLHKRHDTNGRWRQVTKLPRPCPQYPPFTLRYGNMLVLLKLAAHGDPGAATRRSQALRVAARAFEVILFDGAGQAGREKYLPSLILPTPAGSHRARAWAACFTAPHSRRNLNTGYEQGFTLLFSNVRKREQNPLIM